MQQDSCNLFIHAHKFMVTYFMSITDDKDRGWAAPSDDSGKIFTYTRLWACDPQDSTPTYDQAEHFLQFLDKYFSPAIGSHFMISKRLNCRLSSVCV